MAGYPPPPGRDDPRPPLPPPPGAGGWSAAPGAAPGAPPPPSGPFATPGAYGPPPGYGTGAYGEKAGFWARFGAFGVLLAAAIVATVLYFGKLEGGSGQTVGKRAVGIRVVDSRTGGSIGTGRAVGRYFGRIVSSFICLLGYLWMLWDPQKQTWHDKMVNCYVVEA